MTQLAIDFSAVKFHGSVTKELDQKRLSGQMEAIFNIMKDGVWRSLRELHELTGYGEASISAQIRNIRKLGFTIDKRRRGEPSNGLWEYKLTY